MSKTTILTAIALLVFLTIAANTKAEALPIGLGCTTAWYIDKDCDGFGVGVRGSGNYSDPTLLGDKPDADDNDQTVNTPESMLAKYGSLQNFLQQAKGYNPQRIFYIAADGSDTAGEADNINKPFASWAGISAGLRPNDAVIYRAGVYSKGVNATKFFSAEAGSPIILMAYPGELVIMDDCTTGGKGCITIMGGAHLVFDGFSFRNYDNGIYFNGNDADPYKFGGIDNMTIRNIETANTRSGLRGMVGVENVLAENCVLHETDSHGVYWGGTDQGQPNIGFTLRDSIMYRNAKTADGRACFQQNSTASDIIFENNICHSNYTGPGVSFENGVENSVVRNNLFFNNAKGGIICYVYTADPRNSIHDNIFENNTIWMGKNSVLGEPDPEYRPAILLNCSVCNASNGLNVDNHTIRNNIIYAMNGSPIDFYQKDFLDTAIIENNIFYRVAGSDDVMSYGNEKFSLEHMEEFSPLIRNNRFADPKFTDTSIGYNLSPERFDFALLSDSPAIELGSSQGAPATDIKGRERLGNPDAGAYEYYAQEFAITSPSSLPTATKNQAYNYTLQAQNGNTPYTWTIETGTLPVGLNFSDGTITGTPTALETKTFTIKATDSTQQQRTKQFTLTAVQGPECGNGTPETGENCTNCPQDVQCPTGQTCQNGQCIPEEECVNMTTLIGYIGQWKNGTINMATLMQKITKWKTGQGCT